MIHYAMTSCYTNSWPIYAAFIGRLSPIRYYDSSYELHYRCKTPCSPRGKHLASHHDARPIEKCSNPCQTARLRDGAYQTTVLQWQFARVCGKHLLVAPEIAMVYYKEGFALKSIVLS